MSEMAIIGAHRWGCRIAAQRPRRRVMKRTLIGASIVVDRLECGHDYTPCRDRRQQYTATRRCEECRLLSIAPPATGARGGE